MFRNPEVRKELIVYAVITLVAAVAASFFSPVMEKLWQSYQKNYSYAADLSWHTVMDSIRALYRTGGSV